MGWFHFPILQGLGAHKGICDRIEKEMGKYYLSNVRDQKENSPSIKRGLRKILKNTADIIFEREDMKILKRL
jgi:hypothetical protein